MSLSEKISFLTIEGNWVFITSKNKTWLKERALNTFPDPLVWNPIDFYFYF